MKGSNFILIQFFLLDLTRAQHQTVNSMNKLALKMHNKYREKHLNPKMGLSEALTIYAKQCAEYYANLGDIDHSCPEAEVFGENLHMSTADEITEQDFVEEAVKGWYDEEKDYSYNDTTSKTGGDVDHFTQMVWDSTKLFGFAIASANGNVVGVALYSPEGNIEGEYQKNVKKPPPVPKETWFERVRKKSCSFLFGICNIFPSNDD